MQTRKKEKVAAGIVARLRRGGFQAYFIGGCLRDKLMRRVAKDIDIATEAKISQIKKLFHGQTHQIGREFATVLVVKNKIPFQVSTFKGKKGNSNPSLLTDLNARDFTINGLAYDPFTRKIIDLVQAKEDIRKKIIRTIGPATSCFREDPLRLLRAVRFAVTLKFTIAGQTLRAIKQQAKNINRASRERVRDELALIFTSANPGYGLKLLDQSGLLKFILPALARLKGVKQPRAFHPEGDVFTHTYLMLQQLKKPSLLLAYACLFHDIGKPACYQKSDRIRFSGHDRVGAELTRKIITELRFSNKDREAVVACVENHMRMMEAPKMREATLKRLLNRATFKEELTLHRIDCLASHKDLKVWRFLRKKYKQFQNRPIIPKALLSGNELIKLGFTPGPIFGTILNQMIDQQLEGKIKNKSEAKKWVRRQFEKK